jgi:hypothetical protein
MNIGLNLKVTDEHTKSVPETPLSCSLSKTHTGKGLKPLVIKLSTKSLCNLNS